MTISDTTGVPETEEKALEGISVAPPIPADEDSDVGAGATPGYPSTHVRDGADAESHEALKQDPTDADAKLDIELDETFPSSDAPSNTRPGSSDPAPSSGYDEEAEKNRQA